MNRELINANRYQPITLSNVDSIRQWQSLDSGLRESIKVVGNVLPFRTNRFVVDNLIDWSQVPDDPIYQLTFPQRGMLTATSYDTVLELINGRSSPEALREAIYRIRLSLNPHPAGQATANVPVVNDEEIEGIQHKYTETMLFFPSQGQTCHAYCTFCFRWPQFVNDDLGRFRSSDVDSLVQYLRQHKELTDIIFTGGDPMIMKTSIFVRYIEAILDDPQLEHIQNIRIGTKSLAYWPQRFVSDSDADQMLKLFESIVDSGRSLAIMAHMSHPVELEPEVAQLAIRRIRQTGAVIRMQSPLVRHVNDDPELWSQLWQTGVQLGCVPYYLFVERDTGARNYFEVPLLRCWKIFQAAYSQVSGLARTVRGPSMSAWPGKVHILGVRNLGADAAFVLEYLQCRKPELVRRPFFAKFDPAATWFDQLQPFDATDAPMFPQHWSESE